MLDELQSEGEIPADLDRKGVTVEPPRDAAHRDLATNAAMVLARQARTSLRALAELIALRLERPHSPVARSAP